MWFITPTYQAKEQQQSNTSEQSSHTLHHYFQAVDLQPPGRHHIWKEGVEEADFYDNLKAPSSF